MAARQFPSPDPVSRELRLLERLGIPRFRKLILGYEKLRHRRRGGRNPGYHLQGYSMTDAEMFLPVIRKNCRTHLLSLVLLGLYWALSLLRGISLPGAVPITIALIWLNTGCLLLQRWHLLRIRRLREKQKRLRKLSCHSR